MKTQFGTGFLPYEIGDIVEFKDSPFKYRIDDIRFIQYVRDKRAEFEISVYFSDKNTDKWVKIETWIPATRIEKRIK